jgi:hypothetical protein
VTTQFISNIERGVTPLPPAHISTLTRALKIPEEDLMHTLEREYSMKISNRVGRPELAMQDYVPGGLTPGQYARAPIDSSDQSVLSIESGDRALFAKIYEGYKSADETVKESFQNMADTVLHLSKTETTQ